MKAKEREAKKHLTTAELETEIRTAREKRFRLVFKHRASRVENPLELRNLRRHIARLETWLGAKRRAPTAS